MLRWLTFALVASLWAVAPATAQEKVPVQFAQGSSSVTINGKIRGDLFRDYQVAATAGQQMTVSFKPSNASAYFNILPPGSEGEAVFIGSSDGNRFSGPVPGSGLTTIRVYLIRAAARRNESSTYTLSVDVTGDAPAAPVASADALVDGTRYNATAAIPCQFGMGTPQTTCEAGVKRVGGGHATVEIRVPDGTMRQIFFKAGKAESSDAATPIRVERRADVQLIRIGQQEWYEIPDAFVVGG